MPKMASPRPTAFLSTLPARGATRLLLLDLGQVVISIHAPREGSDVHLEMLAGGAPLISIHAPREGSDQDLAADQRILHISIHAPREGSDPRPGPPCKSRSYFYPRSPRGERRGKPAPADGHRTISIHAPREGSDWMP